MEKTKRSFEFRMSKKVAELTQVVHMLFTRNHEREIEMEALKDAYEYEIELVIRDAKQKIEALKQELSTIKKNKSQHQEEQHQELLKVQKEESDRKLKETEKILQDEKTECQNLRDLLISAQSDIEKLRDKVTEQLTFKCEEIDKRDMELDKLKKQNSLLERKLKDNDKELCVAFRDSEKQLAILQDELKAVHNTLNDSLRNRDLLSSRNKELENDLKNAKKDINRKIAEAVSYHINSLGKPHHSESEELERLKKEIQKYKLELSNRDANFNRMFTEKQRISIDPKAGKTSQVNHQSISHVLPYQKPSSFHFQRERSFSQVITLPSHEKTTTTTRPATAISGQLPYLSATPAFTDKDRFAKLIKPKPLPKEMMFTK